MINTYIAKTGIHSYGSRSIVLELQLIQQIQKFVGIYNVYRQLHLGRIYTQVVYIYRIQHSL